MDYAAMNEEEHEEYYQLTQALRNSSDEQLMVYNEYYRIIRPSVIQRCYEEEYGELVCKIIKARCKVLNSLSEKDKCKYEYDHIVRQCYNQRTRSLDQW